MSLPELYSALADPTRLRVLEMLHEKSRPVHELAAAFAISRPAISRHLRVLKEAGLVREVKQGRENVYSFQRAPLKTGAGWIGKYGTAPAAKSRTVKKRDTNVIPPAVVTAAAPTPTPALKTRQTTEPRAKPVAKPTRSLPMAAPQLTLFDI